MEVQETKKEFIRSSADNLTEHLAEHVETYLKLGVVNAIQKATDVASAALATAFVAICFFFVLFFVSMAVAVWVGGIMENPVAGYLTVSGIYTICVLIFFSLRKNIILPFLRDYLVSKAHEE